MQHQISVLFSLNCWLYLDTSNTACLSAQSRPLAFYGAVIQAWRGEQLWSPISLPSAPPGLWSVSRCHQSVNVPFHCCCWAVLSPRSVACSFYWGSVGGHVVRFQRAFKTQRVYKQRYSCMCERTPRQHYLQNKVSEATSWITIRLLYPISRRRAGQN